MNKNNFSYFGQNSSYYGLSVGSVNVYGSPSNRNEGYKVPGRIGVVYPDDSPENWPNETREYIAGLFMRNASEQNVATQLDQIRAWLMNHNTYFTLTDTYEPGVYRRAVFSGEFRPQRIGAGNNFQIPIAFSCDPRRFIVGNDVSIMSAGAADSVRSPQSPQTLGLSAYYKCWPILKAVGANAAFSLSFRDYVTGSEYGKVSFAETNATFQFDCETLACNQAGVITDVTGELYMKDAGTLIVRTGSSGTITADCRWFVR